MAGLDSSFQSEGINSMVAEAVEEYVFDSTEAAYEYQGEHAPMGFMAERGGFHDEIFAHLWDHKHFSFAIHSF